MDWSSHRLGTRGANMPVFVRAALSDPKLDDIVAITYRVDRNDVVVSRLSPR